MFPAMDLESVKHLQKTAVEAAGVEVKNRVCLRNDLPDKTKWMLIDKEGNHTLLDVSQPARAHKLLSVQEVVAFAMLAIAKEAQPSLSNVGHAPIVWIGDETIFVTLDDRRLFGDRATYDFEKTEEFKLLESLFGKSDGFAQKEILRLIRLRLWESFEDYEVRDRLIEGLKKLRSSQASNLGSGSGTFEANVTAAVEDFQWPERLKFRVRPIDDAALTSAHTIECVFEIELGGQPKFHLLPVLSQLSKAFKAAQSEASETIRAQLDKQPIPVFLGQPE